MKPFSGLRSTVRNLWNQIRSNRRTGRSCPSGTLIFLSSITKDSSHNRQWTPSVHSFVILRAPLWYFFTNPLETLLYSHHSNFLLVVTNQEKSESYTFSTPKPRVIIVTSLIPFLVWVSNLTVDRLRDIVFSLLFSSTYVTPEMEILDV